MEEVRKDEMSSEVVRVNKNKNKQMEEWLADDERMLTSGAVPYTCSTE